MTNINFEVVFNNLPYPVVLVSCRGAHPLFLQANPAFFSFTGLTMADLLLGEEWLPALLRQGHSRRGALSEEGLDELRIFIRHAANASIQDHLGIPKTTVIENIAFALAEPIPALIHGQNGFVDLQQQLSLFFNNSIFGAFVMTAVEPIEWNEHTDKEVSLDKILHGLRVTRVNQAMLDQYGIAFEEFIGRTPFDFFEHDLAQERKLLFDICEKGKHRAMSFERNVLGEEVIFEGDYVALFDEQHRINGIFGLQKDVTKRQHYMQRIQDQNEQLREIAWMQSHVVRAPLARILSIIDLFDSGAVQPAGDTLFMLDQLRESAAELDGVIAQIVARTEQVDVSEVEPEE